MEVPYVSAEELNAHVTNEDIHFTSVERTKLNSIEEGANKLEPFVGTTTEITPTQVAEVVIAGRPISISHTDETFGETICNYANIVPDHNSIILSGIAYFDGQFIILELLGSLGDNTWTVFSTTVAEKEYVDNALAEKSDKNHDHDNIYQSKLCEITEEVILSETTVDTITGQGYITCDLEDDVYYQICYNGTNYITKCVRINLLYPEYKLVVGNVACLAGTGDNGIPFSISNHMDGSGIGYTTVEIYDDSSPSSTTISVSKINYSKIASSVIPTIEEMRSKTNLLFPLTDVSGSYDESLSCYWSSIGEFSIINGQTYKVTFDGVEYTRIASIATMAGMSAVAVGNKLVAGGEDTGEPFALFSMNGFAGMIFLDSNDHAVQIEHEIIQKIPTKFVPSITELCSSEIDVYNGTVELDTNGEGYILGNFDNTIVTGGTYKVKWNNIEYKCTAIDASSIDSTAAGIVAFGNIDMLLETGDTGEPFIALYLPSSFTGGESGIRFGVLDDSTGNVQVSIKSIKIEVLPKECIPPLDTLLYDVENVLPTTELSINVSGEASITPTPFIIIPNDEYIIKFNGDVYTCVAGMINDISYIGNLYCMDHEFVDNGLPFLLINGLNSDGQQVLFVVSTYQDQVISLSVDHVKHYVKIPEECLPDYDSDYILPEAGALLGGVKSGGDVTISSGIITVNNDSHNHTIVTVDGL